MKLVSALLLALALLPAAHADDKEAALRKELAAAPPGSEAQKRAGQQLCFQTHGPLAVALWTSDGALVCSTVLRKS